MRAIFVIGDAVLCSDGVTLDFQCVQVRVRNEFKIHYDADAESSLDCLPNTLSAFNLENRIDLEPFRLYRCLKRALAWWSRARVR